MVDGRLLHAEEELEREPEWTRRVGRERGLTHADFTDQIYFDMFSS